MEDTVAGKRIGNYRVVRLLGTGGMGVVYEAVQEEPQRTVALKLVRAALASEEELRRFRYEAQVLGYLRHPGVAQIYEAGTHVADGVSTPFFAMEMVEGGRTLTAHAEDAGLTLQERLSLFALVCDAVHHGHQRGIVHRDLKPANILVDKDGRPKVIDFGIARSVGADLAATAAKTSSGQLIGTLQYMSPEQCATDPNDVDTRSDVYSLGVVLYELVCGALPYEISNLLNAVYVITSEPPARPSRVARGIDQSVEAVLLKALDKERSRRYQSAAELAADVRRYLGNEPVTARPPSFSYHLQSLVRRHRTLSAAVVAVLVVLAAGIGTTTWQWQRASKAAQDARTVSTFFRQALPSPVSMNPMQTRVPVLTPETRVWELLDDAASSIPSSFAGRPDLEATTRLTWSGAYWGIGVFEPAEREARRAQELWRELYGPTDGRTLRARVALAEAVRMQGPPRMDEAQELARAAFAGYLASPAFGPRHPQTLSAMSTLVFTLQHHPATAAELIEIGLEAVQLERDVLGPGAFLTRLTAGIVADALVGAGRLDEAEELSDWMLQASRQVGDGDGYCEAMAIQVQGQIAAHRGDMPRAEELLSEAFDRLKTVWGSGHPVTFPPLATLVPMLLHAERFADAEPLCRYMVEGSNRVFGEDHPYSAWSRAQLDQAILGLARPATP